MLARQRKESNGRRHSIQGIMPLFPSPPSTKKPGQQAPYTSRRHSVAMPEDSTPNTEYFLRQEDRSHSLGFLTHRQNSTGRSSISMLPGGFMSLPGTTNNSRASSPDAQRPVAKRLPTNPLDDYVNAMEERMNNENEPFNTHVTHEDALNSIPDYLVGSDLRRVKHIEREIVELGRQRTANMLGISVHFMKEQRERKFQDKNYGPEYFTQKKKADPNAKVQATLLKLERAEALRARKFQQQVALLQAEVEAGEAASKERREKQLAEMEAKLQAILLQTKDSLAAAERKRTEEIEEKRELARLCTVNLDEPGKLKQQMFVGEMRENEGQVQLTNTLVEKAEEARRQRMEETAAQVKSLIAAKDRSIREQRKRNEQAEVQRVSKIAAVMDTKLEEAAARRERGLLRKAGSAYYRNQVQEMLKGFDSY